MEDNLSYMKDFKPLDAQEQAVIETARAELAKYPVIPCTTCNYCAKVCPQNVGISGTFTAMNCLILYGNKEAAKVQEDWLTEGHGKKRAADCIKCGRCEEACPQHIKIRAELERASKA